MLLLQLVVIDDSLHCRWHEPHHQVKVSLIRLATSGEEMTAIVNHVNVY